jgi:hypothetical protein
VEVVLGELGPEIEQLFWDQLEFWDVEESELIEELESPERLDEEGIANVVRLCYRIEWDESEGEAGHWVDFPKSSDAGAGVFRRLTRTERAALPFVGSTASGRVLSLAPRSSFRELVDQAEGDGLADALEDLVQRLQDLGSDLATVNQVTNALQAVVAPWRVGLGIGDTPAEGLVRFLPEGGVVAAILRSLAPALDLPNAPESLPLVRHGGDEQCGDDSSRQSGGDQRTRPSRKAMLRLRCHLERDGVRAPEAGPSCLRRQRDRMPARARPAPTHTTQTLRDPARSDIRARASNTT